MLRGKGAPGKAGCHHRILCSCFLSRSSRPKVFFSESGYFINKMFEEQPGEHRKKHRHGEGPTLCRA